MKRYYLMLRSALKMRLDKNNKFLIKIQGVKWQYIF